VAVAGGDVPAQRVLTNARVVSTLTGDIEETNVAHDSHNIWRWRPASRTFIRRCGKLKPIRGLAVAAQGKALASLALPVIPELKLTGMGLVDAMEGQPVTPSLGQPG
jgi:adenine deaminase